MVDQPEGRDNHRIVVAERGDPDVMMLVVEDLPEPHLGEARVRVEAAGVSGLDVMVRSMSFPGFTKTPFTPGCDIVGVVDAVSGDVGGLEVGQRVAAGPFFSGGYTEYICLPAEELVPVPLDLDAAEVACLISNYLTAYLLMHETAEVTEGDRILIQGAAGGVGTALLDLGRLAELEMYGTASSSNLDFVASYGATPIDYRSDVVARVHELVPEGVDFVFDPVGGSGQLIRSYRTLRKGGTLLWFGVAGTKTGGRKVIVGSLVSRLVLSLYPDGRKAPMTPTAADGWYRSNLGVLVDLLAEGKIHPLIAERIPLAEAPRAHRLLEQGGVRGKLVLTTVD